MSGIKPTCFVLMPFGMKPDPGRLGQPDLDFDRLYNRSIGPAIADAGMEPIRADQDQGGGIVHKAMLERLILCDFAVAELTLRNANVYYELGVRHSSRNSTTLLLFADHVQLPFDLAPVGALSYAIGKDNTVSDDQLAALRGKVADSLRALRERARSGRATDSPFFQLVGSTQGAQAPLDQRLRRIRDSDASLYEILNVYAQHEKTDVFRTAVAYSDRRRRQLADARSQKKVEGLAQLDAIRAELGTLEQVEAGVIVDLFLSYRAFSCWGRMIALYEDMPEVLRRSVLVREQRALALNRLAGADPRRPEFRTEAVRILEEVRSEIGPNPETLGLLGRVYKDRWRDALAANLEDEAQGQLGNAIEAYGSGFRADFRDAYPGINALTLLEIEGSPKSLAEKEELLPVVRFAVKQKMARGIADYWDLATQLELEVLAGDAAASKRHLAKALGSDGIESFMPRTTADNLTDVANARRRRGDDGSWLWAIIEVLTKKAGPV